MRFRTVLMPLIAALALAACNTVEGAGKDITKAGHVVTNEAQKAQ